MPLKTMVVSNRWLGKSVKKAIYEAVNRDIDRDKLKKLKEERKEKNKLNTSKSPEAVEHSGTGKKKSKGKRR